MWRELGRLSVSVARYARSLRRSFVRSSVPSPPHGETNQERQRPPKNHHNPLKMSSLRVRKVMTQPINLIFRFLQNQQRISVWLFNQSNLRIEGVILVRVPGHCVGVAWALCGLFLCLSVAKGLLRRQWLAV